MPSDKADDLNLQFIETGEELGSDHHSFFLILQHDVQGGGQLEKGSSRKSFFLVNIE